MTEGIKYIGDGQFIITEEWLREVYGLAVEMKIANWLGVDNWEGWWDTQEAIIYDWMNKS